MSNKLRFLSALITWFMASCSAQKYGQKTPHINGLQFWDSYVIPFNENFDSTIIGGLSGIDYDSKKEVYYLISDDRSAKNPARFYTAKINIKQDKIDTVLFLKTTFLKNKVGNFYPNSRQDPSHTPDPEALRFNPKNNTFAWSSEGERIINQEKMILENPAVTEIDLSGNYLDTFHLPPLLKTISKKLLLNMDDLGFYIDNIEGVTLGPILPNGKKSLLFVADNNFNPFQKTQILLFEIK